MIAVPIAVVLFGYWVLYAGVKRVSLADAWNCTPQQQQTAGDQSGRPGAITITGPGSSQFTITTDCTVRAGDTKVPIPGTGQYMILRPNKGTIRIGPVSAPAWITGPLLLGPCGG